MQTSKEKCSNCPGCFKMWLWSILLNKCVHVQKKDAHRSHCPAAGWGFPPPLSWWSPPLCSGSSWTAGQRQYRCVKHTTRSAIYLVFTALLLKWKTMKWAAKMHVLGCFLNVFPQLFFDGMFISPPVLIWFWSVITYPQIYKNVFVRAIGGQEQEQS